MKVDNKGAARTNVKENTILPTGTILQEKYQRYRQHIIARNPDET